MQLELQAKAVAEQRRVDTTALRRQELILALRIAKFYLGQHRGEVISEALRGAERFPTPNVSTAT
jgi:hypothetical protein